MPRMKQISIDVDVNRVVEANRQSFAESENDILRRLLVPAARQAGQRRNVAPNRGRPESRHRGDWAVCLLGEEHRVANMKDGYCELLRLLAGLDPEFLPRFSVQKSRSRRFVARSAESLYEASPHLAKDHAKVLTDGWFVDTNLSKQQVGNRARSAAETAGLRYGQDVKITEAGRAIG